MQLSTALLVYLLVLIFVLILARLSGIRAWSAVALAVLISFIVLILVQPLSLESILSTSTSYILLYSFIVFLTMVILFVYILDKTLSDREVRYITASVRPASMHASQLVL